MNFWGSSTESYKIPLNTFVVTIIHTKVRICKFNNKTVKGLLPDLPMREDSTMTRNCIWQTRFLQCRRWHWTLGGGKQLVAFSLLFLVEGRRQRGGRLRHQVSAPVTGECEGASRRGASAVAFGARGHHGGHGRTHGRGQSFEAGRQTILKNKMNVAFLLTNSLTFSN